MRAVALLLALSACAMTGGGPGRDEPTQAAEQAIAATLSETFSGPNLDAAANCGVSNTSTEELQSLAARGPDRERIFAIMARPGTRQCLADNGVVTP